MTDKKIKELLVDVQEALYQQAGVSVQVYGQSILVSMIKDAYDFIYKDRFWKRYMTFQTYTLVGTTGYTTTPVSTIFKEFEDIKSIFPGTSDIPLVAWSMERNPSQITGGAPLQYLADVTNIVKILPITATGEITILGRTNLLVTPVNLETTIPFDSIAIKFFAAWQYSIDDGANSAQAKKFETLYNKRIEQLIAADLQAPIAINGRAGRIPDTWEEW